MHKKATTKKHCLIALIVHYVVHAHLSHAGVASVNSTRTVILDTNWTSARVKKLLRCCQTRRKYGGKPYTMPDLAVFPKIRKQQVSPFSITGVNFTGALYVIHVLIQWPFADVGCVLVSVVPDQICCQRWKSMASHSTVPPLWQWLLAVLVYSF